ncbi:acyl-CoA thioesterase [Abyssibacter sp.]|jgi:acyl-CoA thioester hydrolase|uniref:acyl-CoA thioesterase n=1 Tax=Abyssibacter sp. TaxID=2320200 RepID=UPI0035183B6C
MHQHETLLTVPFHDADMMGVTWHGHYIRYMEIARCELLERIGYTYLDMYDSGYAWPVVDLKIRYSKGCTFGDRLRILITVDEVEFRFKLSYRIENADTGELLTKAATTQVAVDTKTGEMSYPSPKILVDRIEAFAAGPSAA